VNVGREVAVGLGVAVAVGSGVSLGAVVAVGARVLVGAVVSVGAIVGSWLVEVGTGAAVCGTQAVAITLKAAKTRIKDIIFLLMTASLPSTNLYVDNGY
jgi:hypothetical protein